MVAYLPPSLSPEALNNVDKKTLSKAPEKFHKNNLFKTNFDISLLSRLNFGLG